MALLNAVISEIAAEFLASEMRLRTLGTTTAARIAIITTTTRISISVKPWRRRIIAHGFRFISHSSLTNGSRCFRSLCQRVHLEDRQQDRKNDEADKGAHHDD